MKPEQAVLYIKDVALILGKEYPAVQALHQRGQLPPSFKLGGKVAWLRGDFMAWLAGLANTAKEGEREREKHDGKEAVKKGGPGRKRMAYEYEIKKLNR